MADTTLGRVDAAPGHGRSSAARISAAGDSQITPVIVAMRVLHVEDENLDAFVIRHALEAAGFNEIELAQTPAAFTAALERGEFDVIVCDNRVCGMSGLQALEAARTRRPDVPFVVLSGDDQYRGELMQAGATAYVTKQQLPQLVAVLRSLAPAAEIPPRAT